MTTFHRIAVVPAAVVLLGSAIPSVTRAGNSEQVSLTETEVKELSAIPLDPNSFEVPTNFRSVLSPQALLGLRVAWWARWLAWGHYYWVRFRKAI